MSRFLEKICGEDALAYPWQAVRGWSFGVLLTIFVAAVFAGYDHLKYPPMRPTLLLESTTVPMNGALSFVSAPLSTTRVCPEETRRMIFRLIDPSKGVMSARRVLVLSDFTSVTAGEPEGSFTEIPLPVGVVPGEWYYQRHTWSWCTPLNWVFGPSYFVTAPIKFTVVAAR